MDMLGKELPLYQVDTPHSAGEHIIGHGEINGQKCSLSVIREEGDHLVVATVGNNRIAISGNQLLGVAVKVDG